MANGLKLVQGLNRLKDLIGSRFHLQLSKYPIEIVNWFKVSIAIVKVSNCNCPSIQLQLSIGSVDSGLKLVQGSIWSKGLISSRI